jgi:hypothetical protein
MMWAPSIRAKVVRGAAAFGNCTMKKYQGIRYGFRPKSYWAETDPLSAILRNVTGENRRQMISDYWASGKIEELDVSILQDEVDADTRTNLGRIHPSFMGGEFLPPYLPGETEIARIKLKSTTSDVISLRARPIPEGIAYRVVDEYSAEFALPIPRSIEPLTLAELIRQFDEGSLEDGFDSSVGLALGYNWLNVDEDNHQSLRHFTSISSQIYRQLHDHFEHVYDEWLALCLKEQKEDAEKGEAA